MTSTVFIVAVFGVVLGASANMWNHILHISLYWKLDLDSDRLSGPSWKAICVAILPTSMEAACASSLLPKVAKLDIPEKHDRDICSVFDPGDHWQVATSSKYIQANLGGISDTKLSSLVFECRHQQTAENANRIIPCPRYFGEIDLTGGFGRWTGCVCVWDATG